VVLAQALDSTITVAIGSDITTLDPHETTDTDSASIRYHIYEGLVHVNSQGDPVPQLAKSWTISEDGLTYTFKLREGVQFQDGADFNALAVKIAFDRVTDPGRSTSASDYMTMIADTEVIDDFTVAVTLKEPFGPFLNHLGVHAGHIPSPRAVEQYGENLGDHPIGTGPFRFVERVRGDRIVLERWEGYWGDEPDIQRIVYKVVPEAGARIAMLETGEADVILRVTPEEVQRLNKSEGINVTTIQTGRTMYFALNTKEPPFDDVRVRQAANYAVDKKAIIEFLFGAGTTIPVDNPLAPAMFGYTPIRSYPFDPDRARELLAETGNPHPSILMWAPQARFPQGVEVTQVVQQQLQQAGFNVEVRIWGDYPAYLDTFNSQMTEQDAVLMGWAASTLDAEGALRQPLHGERAGKFINTGGYGNPKVDSLMDAARASSSPDERRELYAQLAGIVMEDAPWIFLYYGTVSYGQSDRISGVDYRPTEVVLFLDAKLAD